MLSTIATTDAYAGRTLRFCGMGSVSNYPQYSTTLKCTDLLITPASDCGSIPNTICSQWNDRDNNVCNGDYGGKLYEYVSHICN